MKILSITVLCIFCISCTNLKLSSDVCGDYKLNEKITSPAITIDSGLKMELIAMLPIKYNATEFCWYSSDTGGLNAESGEKGFSFSSINGKWRFIKEYETIVLTHVRGK